MKANEIKADEIIAVTYYTKVVDTLPAKSAVDVRDLDRGFGFTITGAELLESGFSADQFEKNEKLPLTKIVEIFERAWNKPFTVVYEKQNGEERTLRGYMVNPETGLGRSQVIDLDIERKAGDYDNRLRQVDHRTIKSLILDGTKYSRKK